ncbi:LAQU0S01e07096g1_1 [Lachancea quebecensis]|uniref:LAQU0S01e07096g1_1 n=1 Tax=Lachancea quebecensis TaxID=1654605 RepID=A0A0P1KPF2_9SACH|nr:LAQU0S01e07096g1_1 [Lachancea quebecensis]
MPITKMSLEIQRKPFKTPFLSSAKREGGSGSKAYRCKEISYSNRQVSKEERILNEQIKKIRRDNTTLQNSLKILRKYERELEVLELIVKWRSICQAGMAYLMNSTLLKVNKMGGYEELIRKEVEAEKRRLEYQFAGRLQDEVDGVLDSEEFKALPESEQQWLRKDLQQKVDSNEKLQQNEIKKLDSKLNDSTNKQMTMQELANRLKVDYVLIFEV